MAPLRLLLPRDRRARPAAGDGRADAGFTLVEVVIALVLLTVLMSAVAALFVGGIRNGAGLQRRQAAVAVAAQAIEAERAVAVQADPSGCVKLLQGRTLAGVNAQWSAVPSTVDLSTSDRAVMPAGCSGPLVVPYSGVPRAAGAVPEPVLLNGLAYSVRTFIGTCRVGGPGAGCLRTNTGPRLYRVIVAVTWTGSGCGAGCQYAAATLLDPSADPVYNVRGASAPVAAPDALCFPANTSAAFSLVANDSGVLGRTPVTVVTAPSHGTLSATVATGVSAYTPAAGYTGTDSFSYRLTDVNGLISPVATVSITVAGTCP